MPLAALLVQAHMETVLTEVGRPTKEAGWGGKGARGRGAGGGDDGCSSSTFSLLNSGGASSYHVPQTPYPVPILPVEPRARRTCGVCSMYNLSCTGAWE